MAMTAFVALLSATFYSSSDFLGGLASRKQSALVVTLGAQAVGAALVAAVVLASPPASWTDPRILWGLVSGACGGTGVLALYAGLATGRMSIVAPVTAALSGSIPAATGILFMGDELRWTALLGIVLALVAVVVVSASAEDDGSGSGRKAMMFAVISGLGFSLSIMAYSRTPAETGMAPLLLARLVAVVLFAAAAAAQGRSLAPASGARRMVLVTGVLDVAANVTQVIALRLGPVSIAAVIGSLYPVGTVLLARFVLHEHLHPIQRAGIVMSLVAVVLTALP